MIKKKTMHKNMTKSGFILRCVGAPDFSVMLVVVVFINSVVTVDVVGDFVTSGLVVVIFIIVVVEGDVSIDLV